MTTLSQDTLPPHPRQPFAWGRALAWLGLSLIGLGAFYRRFVVPPAVAPEPSVAAQ